MKFAELTQEVQVTRSIPNKVDPCFTPGRRKANQLFKMAVNHLEENGYSEARKLEVDLGLVYSLGPSFPDFKLHSPENEKTLKELVQFLEQRIQKRILLCKDFDARSKNNQVNNIVFSSNTYFYRGSLPHAVNGL